MYDEMYSEHSRLATVSEFAEQRVREIVSDFTSYRTSGEFLDIGSGAGSLLAAATEQGWNATGTEVSDSAVGLLRQRGLSVFQGLLHDAKFADNKFDVVTASEVLEHVYEPFEFVSEIHRILRPGGLFWLSTPHGHGLAIRLLRERWSQVEPPVHINLFSSKGLNILLKRAGFKSVSAFSLGTNPHEVLHNLRKKVDVETQHNHLKEKLDFVDPVELNAAFSKSPLRRAVKSSVNAGLKMFRLGDSLKGWAVK